MLIEVYSCVTPECLEKKVQEFVDRHNQNDIDSGEIKIEIQYQVSTINCAGQPQTTYSAMVISK